MGFFRKKEEKKKFDYSDDTKELFAERDAFYARMRQEMGGGETNPELANQKTSRDERPKEDDLGDLLGDSDFNPYANKEEVGGTGSIAAPSAPSSGSAAKCLWRITQSKRIECRIIEIRCFCITNCFPNGCSR